MVKKLFISQPMRGLTQEEIEMQRCDAVDEMKIKEFGDSIVVIDSIIKDAPEDATPLWYLGRSVQLLGEADVACFIGNWKEYRGCRIEYQIAKEYDIPIYDLSEKVK